MEIISKIEINNFTSREEVRSAILEAVERVMGKYKTEQVEKIILETHLRGNGIDVKEIDEVVL